MSRRVRAVSYGGGVQSTALLVLAAQRRIDFDVFLFANVGDDSEHPDSLAYVRQIAVPYAAEHGIELVELHRTRRDGSTETLMQRLDAPRSTTTFAIPVRRAADGPPMARNCTADFKISVVAKELKRRGATRDEPATVALGISVDEIQRARPGTDPRVPEQTRTYPLLDLGMHRTDCAAVIADAGLPVPSKSSCWFCPFHSKEAWRNLKRLTPELFEAACALEERLTAGARDGRPVYLTRHGRPLAETLDDQLMFEGFEECDSGWCMT